MHGLAAGRPETRADAENSVCRYVSTSGTPVQPRWCGEQIRVGLTVGDRFASSPLVKGLRTLPPKALVNKGIAGTPL